MADPNPHTLDALLDAINTGDAATAATLAHEIAHATLPPRCSNCGSTEFLVSQFTWNRQGYDSETGDWGSTYSGDGSYEDHPYKAECADCDTDCTDLLFGVIAFDEEPDWTERKAERPAVDPFLASQDVRA